MALTPRHKFVVQKITECFSPSLDNTKVQSFIRKNENIARLNTFFAGDGSGKIFVHHQSKSTGVGPDGGTDNAAEKTEPELFFSNGDAHYMDTKCCYFLRSTGGKPVDTSVGNDKTVLYGEISESPLETIEALLSGSFQGLFASSAEWGKVSLHLTLCRCRILFSRFLFHFKKSN